MTANWNEKVRPTILAGICACVAAVLVWALVAPKPFTKPKPPYQFSTDFVTPPGWTLQSDAYLPPSSAAYDIDQGDLPLTAKLRYVEDLRIEHTADSELFTAFLPWDAVPLDVWTHYLVDLRGKMRPNARTAFAEVRAQPVTVLHRDGLGSASLWRDGRSVHFSAVVCPTGESAAIRPQFSHNLYVKQLTLAEIAKNRFKHGSLLDPRAITLEISVPEGEGAEKKLETAGFHWIQWCSQHFPSI